MSPGPRESTLIENRLTRRARHRLDTPMRPGYRPIRHPIAYGDIDSPYGMQRDPRSFARPLEFDPHRWTPERGDRVLMGAAA
jgi:hypothetical protein